MRSLDLSHGPISRRDRQPLRFPPPPRWPWFIRLAWRRPVATIVVLYLTWLTLWAVYGWMGFVEYRADAALLH